MKDILNWIPGAILVLAMMSFESVQACETRNLHEGEIPLQGVLITIAPGAREKLFEALEAYADEQGFAIRIVQISSDNKKFGIDMWRSDIKIFGDNLLDINTFRIDYYCNDLNHPPSDAALHYQLVRLKSAVDLVPEAEYSVIKEATVQ